MLWFRPGLGLLGGHTYLGPAPDHRQGRSRDVWEGRLGRPTRNHYLSSRRGISAGVVTAAHGDAAAGLSQALLLLLRPPHTVPSGLRASSPVLPCQVMGQM